MLKFIWSKVFGKCIVKCKAADAENFIRLVREGAYTTDPIIHKGDEYTVTLPELHIGRLKKVLDSNGIEYTAARLAGIPRLIHKYKYRPGIIIGAILFFFVIGLSERVIWDFDITGNKTVSDLEIIEALESRGCSAGDFYSDIDFSLVQNDCLIDAGSLAWVSVNMDGNLARVEVREKRIVPIEHVPEKGRFANIIAAEDGVIEICRVKNGKAVVEPGTVVKKGELLISGVIDLGETDVRYEYAEGEVLAKVYRRIESYVPFERTVQVPTGKESSEIQLKIFGKSINLSSRGRIEYDLYGKIEDSDKLSLPFGITLPVWMTKTVYSQMHEVTETVSEDEALCLAREDVSEKLREMVDTFQVLSLNENCTADENGVTVTLDVYGVTDISANYGFSVSGDGAE